MIYFFKKNQLPILLLVIIFSPYVFTSVRFDHILFIFLSILLLFRKIPKISLFNFLILIMMYVTIITSTLYHLVEGGVLSPISPILDSLEWYLRGAIIILFVSGMSNLSTRDVLTISKVYIFSSIFIAAVAVLQILEINNIILDNFLTFYTPGRENERMLHAISGRYSSILGQPVSYGVFFLFAVTILLFYGDKIIYSRIIRYFIFLFVFVSSYFSISKIILIGVPILMLTRLILFLTRFVNLRMEDCFCWLMLLGTSFFVTLESNIFAAEHLVNNYQNHRSLLDVIDFAVDVRFNSVKGHLFEDMIAFKSNLIFGIGWSHFEGVRLGDSGYLPILVRSGILGMFFYSLYLLSVFGTSFFSLIKNLGVKHPIVMNYLFLFLISSIFALGSPIFYIDRSSDFFWMISAVAIGIIKKMPNTAYKY